MFVKEKEIRGVWVSEIVLYSKLQAFEFKHLPSPGGVLDQNPIFLDRMLYIMTERAKYEERQREREKRNQPGMRVPGRRPSGRRGR